ncbi:MAG: hypothetical protein ACU0D2_12025 [Roseovarius indicus]
MVSTSKILTVSYGTFSCTLEGFDDSFDTMKAIAEYFRDLAADDRYFGAEPPTPDAEMLARIAEREIARRVEAHENEGRIVLRASEAANAAAQAEPQPAPKPEPKQIAAAAALASVEEETEALKTAIHEHTEDEAEAAEAAEPAPLAESPAFEQQPLVATAPVAEDPVIAEEEIVVEEETVIAEEATIEKDEDDAAFHEAFEGLTAEDDSEEYDDEDTDAFAEITYDEEDEDLTAGYDEDYAEDDVEEVLVTPAPEPATDSVAARLRRIRSVVAHSSDGYATDDYSEDEHAQDFLQRTAAELDATLAEDDAATATVEDEIEENDPFANLTARLAQDDADDAEEEATADEPAEAPHAIHAETDEDDFDDELADDTLAQLLADAMPSGAGPQPQTEPETVAEAQPEAAEAEPLVLTGKDQVTGEAERPLRARVLKMKRSEFEAAIASGQIEEDFDTEDEAEAETQPQAHEAAALADDSDTYLSPEDEAELQRELAEVEAEMEQGAPIAAPLEEPIEEPVATLEDEQEDEPVEEDAAEEPEIAYEDEIEAPAAAAHQPDPEPEAEPDDAALDDTDEMHPSPRAARLQEADTESDASRLFDTADTHFDAPDSNKRRNAIQHLRAAVAATKAEKNAGSTLEQETDEEAYRSDLASVVRPRRHRASAPAEDAPRSRRPGADQRQAPLKLVAEQRVDTSREPVRPRRVSAQLSGTAGSTPVEEGGFGEFAEQIGATTLPELLEAAAAYMADVEGRQQFSRPMLMGKLKEVEHESFSREDGLRSFGHLLRQGKLQKVKGGRFSVTEQTEFRGQARHAG